MRRSPRSVPAALAVLAATALAACAGGGDAGPGEVPIPPQTASGSAQPGGSVTVPPVGEVPALQVEVVAEGLAHGWDIGFIPDGGALVTERSGRISHLSSTSPGATVSRVEADLSGVFASGEGGLLGMVVHPDFATSREFTVCMNYQEGGDPVDIRLVTWRLAEDARSAERVRDLLTGIPTGSGRHSGCRPTVDAAGMLVVGTGDIADGAVPQDLTSLGGKVLRLDLSTGEPAPDNPFLDSADERERYVLSYGHRNIQGVTVRPGTGEIYTAEHGPNVNDEVNRIVAGGNYGWDPSQGGEVGGYDESVPMTDLERFPDAVPAVWQTGGMTEALCGAAFLEGEQWGALDGALLVTALRGAKAVLLTLDDGGEVAEVSVPEELDDEFGRLRAARLGPDGAVYVTTSNGENDKVLRVTPAGP
ncbi:PQQ-dependent sugar dehydrogenase [Nostocoides sp. F2B08]|uniref:PQQ-dependent sugar dehydrogenase n=1 Tax=Nostocoides sp. F2B08 TaxID=2653936 RepID=UPI0012635EAC|nr:PQQ-dependent sugar dehydrogenase [Tetrasphaera sp. F2B08]KAB7743878.1 PQQ-dependent sugar dehydrogenase [Tetrasphaera sp. F2B08]